ncbi:MAG TPA: ABC transporter permease [Bryobacteraceae bacterium]|nr:ABC transporter permease [Bryobacteraceae bacterium]
MNWRQRLWDRANLEQQLSKELQFHLDERIASLVRSGLDGSEARRMALMELGGIEQTKEACRDERGTLWLESTFQDCRYALRTLRKTPVFTFAAILTLALGIGANTAIFQLLDAVRLRSLPVFEPQNLARVQIGNGRGFGVAHYPDNLSYPLFEQIRDHQQGFSGVFAWDSGYGTERVGQGEQVRNVAVLRVSGDFFGAIGVPAAAGRLLGPQDDERGCPAPAVVLGYTFWQREFGGQRSAIGSRVVVNGLPLEIAGVSAEGFTGPEVGPGFDLALPLCSLAVLHPGDQPPFARRDYFWLNVMGRLRPGWTTARASAQLEAISPGMMEATVPSGYKSVSRYLGFRIAAFPGATGVSRLREEYDDSLWLLLGLTGLVLLIACANLANLVLARAGARQREFAVRVALGAGRGRLIRQSLAESLVLAVSGTLAGLWLASAMSHGILSFLNAGSSAVQLDLGFDWRMLAFTAALTCATCVLLGLAPALRSSRTPPADVIKSGSRGVTENRSRFGFQRLLVVLQVSVSLVVLTTALLFTASFRRLVNLDPGFRASGLLMAEFDLPREAAVHRQLLEEIRATPGVQSVAATSNFLLGGGSWSLGIRPGSAPAKAESKFTWVTPGYFTTLETPILAGRDFSVNDSETGPKVAIVNQNFARQFFPGSDVLGKTFRTVAEPRYPEAEYQIVGVIRNTRYFSIHDPEPPMAYGVATQYPPGPAGHHLYVRCAAPPATVKAAVTRRIASWRPGTPTQIDELEQRISGSLRRERLLAALSGFFGALAALLAGIGLYALLAYYAVRRRNEIGIRVALGASRGQIVTLVLREAAMLVVAGLGAGLAGSLWVTKAAASLLFEVSAHDPWQFGSAALALAAAAALGSILPARRASRLDPLTALRDE